MKLYVFCGCFVDRFGLENQIIYLIRRKHARSGRRGSGSAVLRAPSFFHATVCHSALRRPHNASLRSVTTTNKLDYSVQSQAQPGRFVLLIPSIVYRFESYTPVATSIIHGVTKLVCCFVGPSQRQRKLYHVNLHSLRIRG